MGWGPDFGYLGFRFAPPHEAQEIPVHVLISEQLPDHWAHIDDFEGDGYRRVLCQYELENGPVGVGYIYAIND
jgi:hypothetical protein